MQHYRVYQMDKAGRIAQAHDVRCDCDEDARLEGARQAGAHGAEVWQGSRLVARFMAAESRAE